MWCAVWGVGVTQKVWCMHQHQRDGWHLGVKLVGLEQGSMSVWKRIGREMVKDVFCNTAVCVLSCVQAWGRLT